MKKIIILCSLAIVIAVSSCHKVAIGYLLTDNALYAKDFEVFITPDPVIDKVRINYKSPWVGKPISGVLGTEPIFYTIVDIESEDGNADVMKNEVSIYGDGRFNMPFEMKTPPGTYKVTIKISNEDHSAVKPDILTIIVKEKRK